MSSTEELLDEVSRLLALQLRRDMESQNEAIIEFARVGISNTRIADLLGTTPATVKTTVQRAKAGRKSTRSGKEV